MIYFMPGFTRSFLEGYLMTYFSPLTIVIPCYNESARLPAAFENLSQYKRVRAFDVVFVENGSVDSTWAILQAFCKANPWARAIRTARGKGRAVRAGVLAACGDLIYTADVDFSAPLSELETLEREIDEFDKIDGFDIAIGSREVSPAMTETTLTRRIVGRAFHTLAGGLTGVSDSQCGFKLYRRNVAWGLFSVMQTSGLAFDVEILYLARQFGYRVIEVPIFWKHDPDSRVNLVTDSWRMAWDVLKIPVIHAQLNKIKLPA
jgi:dolichyl-phosphate beta-glucosyltransferase